MADLRQIYDAAIAMVSGNELQKVISDTASGKACELLFPLVYDGEIHKAKWPWAVKRQIVAAEIATEEASPGGQQVPVAGPGGKYPEFARRFPLPEGHTRFIGWGGTKTPKDGHHEGDYVYSDQPSPAIMIYLGGYKEDQETGLWTVPAVEDIKGPFLLCVTLRLAVELASKLRRDENQARRLYLEYQQALEGAFHTVTPFKDYPSRTLGTMQILESGPVHGR